MADITWQCQEDRACQIRTWDKDGDLISFPPINHVKPESEKFSQQISLTLDLLKYSTVNYYTFKCPLSVLLRLPLTTLLLVLLRLWAVVRVQLGHYRLSIFDWDFIGFLRYPLWMSILLYRYLPIFIMYI